MSISHVAAERVVVMAADENKDQMRIEEEDDD